jgi:hypothetical protein
LNAEKLEIIPPEFKYLFWALQLLKIITIATGLLGR